jgi:hypothetical protein
MLKLVIGKRLGAYATFASMFSAYVLIGFAFVGNVVGRQKETAIRP